MKQPSAACHSEIPVHTRWQADDNLENSNMHVPAADNCGQGGGVEEMLQDHFKLAVTDS